MRIHLVASLVLVSLGIATIACAEEKTEVKHLFGAKLLLEKIQQVEPTPQQLAAFDKLSGAQTAKVQALREANGITKELIKKRDISYRAAQKAGLEGDPLWKKIQADLGISDTQLQAFRQTKTWASEFRKQALALLTEEQRKRLPKKKK